MEAAMAQVDCRGICNGRLAIPRLAMGSTEWTQVFDKDDRQGTRHPLTLLRPCSGCIATDDDMSLVSQSNSLYADATE